MENTLLPPSEPQDLGTECLKIRDVHCVLNNLSKFLGGIEHGIRRLVHPDPSDTSQGFYLEEEKAERLRQSIDTTRLRLKHLFQILGSEALLENPPAMILPNTQNQNSLISIGRRLNSGLTGCHNTLQRLLDHDKELLKKEIVETTIGQRCLVRLASLSMVLNEIKLESSDEIQAMVSTLKEKTVLSPEVLPKPTPNSFEANPIVIEEPQIPLEKNEPSLSLVIPMGPTEELIAQTQNMDKESADEGVKPEGSVVIPISTIQKEEAKTNLRPKRVKGPEPKRESLPDKLDKDKPLAIQLAEAFVPTEPCLQINREFEGHYPGCLNFDLYRIDEMKTGEKICKDFRTNFDMKDNEAIVGLRGKFSWKILMIREDALALKNPKEEA